MFIPFFRTFAKVAGQELMLIPEQEKFGKLFAPLPAKD